VVRKGFPVPPLRLLPVLQREEEITKRDDVDGVWTGRTKRKEKTTKPNDETKL
jgi:hypothetical protein